jgi:hypothetical protein
MQVLLWRWTALVLSLSIVSAAAAQTSRKPTQKAATWKQYCQGEEGFCFKYPPSWSMLGEIFDGNGVVVAPPQNGDRAVWDEVTVALVIPPPEGDEDPVSIDQAIEKAVSSVREGGQSFETLQRQRRKVDDKPAELLKLHYVDKSNGREWIEELTFIEGPESGIYSVALKCAPSSLARMEPLFVRIVESWKLPEIEPPPVATDEEKVPPKKPGSPAAPSKSVPPPSPPKS